MRKLLTLLLLSSSCWAVCTQPTISGVAVSSSADGLTATITWNTPGVPSDSLVAYGVNGAATLTAITDAAGVTVHSVSITDITAIRPGQQFDYGIRSRAISGGSPCDYHYYAFYGGGDNGIHFTMAAVVTTNPFDYYINPIGQQHVTAGSNMFVQLESGVLAGVYTNNSLSCQVTGFPPNSIGHWPSTQDMKVGADTVSTVSVTGDKIQMYSISQGNQQEFELETNQGGTTTAGGYTLTFTCSGSGKPTHTANFAITVDAATSPFGIASSGFIAPIGSATAPVSFNPIPSLSTWSGAMTTYGTYWCAEDRVNANRIVRANDSTQSNLVTVSASIQKDAWYYDGIRVYNGIENYLGNPTQFDQCITNILAVYRDGPNNGGVSVLGNSGAINMILHFPEGEYLDYQRHGTAADVTAIDDLDAHTANAQNGTMVPVRYLQREAAYSLNDDFYENKLGHSQTRLSQNTTFWMKYHLDHVLGHIDQICLSQNATYYETFMTGLEARALIDYFEDGNQDVRIPSAVKCLADYIFSNAWNTITSDGGTFQYDNWRGQTNQSPANSGASNNVLLDMLIAPMYAWLYKETGNATYETEFQTIFGYGASMVGADGQGGGLAGSLGFGLTGGNGGKQFSQYFYWSDLAVKWDTAPAGAPIASFSPSSLAFGTVAVNTTASLSTTLTNTGTGSLTITSQTVTGAPFSITGNTCGGTLGVSATCSITVRFAPTSLGISADNISMVDNASGSPHTVPLTGSTGTTNFVNFTGLGNKITGLGVVVK